MPDRRRPEDPFVVRMQAKRLADSINASSQKETGQNATLAQRLVALWGLILAFLSKAAVIPVLAAALWLLWGSATKSTIIIKPVSAPEALVKKGYTGELIADLLRAELDRMIVYARSMKQGANILGKEDIPDVSLPNTAISADAVAKYLRGFFGIKQYWEVDCTVTETEGKLNAYTKISNKIETDRRLVSIEAPDVQKLVEAAARQVLGAADPTILSYYGLRNNENEFSIAIANGILADRGTDETTLLLAHNMLGNNLRKLTKGSSEAEREYRFAIAGAERKAFDPVNFIRALAGHDDTLQMYGAIINNLGVLFYDRGDAKFAEQDYRLAMIIDPKDPDTHTNLGNLLKNHKQDIAGAEREYRLAINLDPKNSNAHAALGVLLKDHKQDIAGAEEEYRLAINLDPKNSYAHNNLGVLLEMHKQDIVGAEREYRLAIDSDPKHSMAHNNLGNLLKNHKQDIVGAEREYRLAIDSDPKHSMAHNNLALLLEEKDQDPVFPWEALAVDHLYKDFFVKIDAESQTPPFRIYEIIRHFRKANESDPDLFSDWRLEKAQEKLCHAEIAELRAPSRPSNKKKKHR